MTRVLDISLILVQLFGFEDVPISIGVILDLSGSKADKLGKAREAAIEFFQNRQSTR